MTKQNTTKNDFVKNLGPTFAPHLLRRLHERMVGDSDGLFKQLGIKSKPRWSSILLLLGRNGPQSVTDIAKSIHLTHPRVIKLIGAIEKEKFIKSQAHKSDGRKRIIALTTKGKSTVSKLESIQKPSTDAMLEIFETAGYDLIEVVEKFNKILDEKNLADRTYERIKVET